jgi:group I intron endonuclease
MIMGKVSGIYAWVAPDGGVYIGSSTDLKGRKANHWNAMCRHNHRNNRLQAAYDIHGEALIFETREICNISELRAREQWHIDAYKPSLNISQSAENVMRDPTIRAKHSAVMASDDLKVKRSAASKAVAARPEYLAIKSAASKKARACPENKAKHSAKMREIHADPEYKAAVSARSTETNARPGHRERISAAMKAFRATPGEKEKSSIRMHAHYALPGKREATGAKSREVATKRVYTRATDNGLLLLTIDALREFDLKYHRGEYTQETKERVMAGRSLYRHLKTRGSK